MADNYLERRMEDLRSGRLKPMVPKRTTTGTAPSRRKTLEGVCAVVAGGADGTGLETVKLLRSAGACVDILDSDRKAGAAAAQTTGARFTPVDLSDQEAFEDALEEIRKFRGKIDMVITMNKE